MTSTETNVIMELFIYFEVTNFPGLRLLAFRGTRSVNPQDIPWNGPDKGSWTFSNRLLADDCGEEYTEWGGTIEGVTESDAQALVSLRNTYWAYRFFSDPEDNKNIFYSMGHDGETDAYPGRVHPQRLTRQRLNESLSNHNRDHNAMFGLENNYAYFHTNEPNNWTPDKQQSAVGLMNKKFLEETGDTEKPTTIFTPVVTAHDTFTFHFCEEEMVINKEVSSRAIQVGADEAYRLGIIPIYTYSITKEPASINKEDFMKYCPFRPAVLSYPMEDGTFYPPVPDRDPDQQALVTHAADGETHHMNEWNPVAQGDWTILVDSTDGDYKEWIRGSEIHATDGNKVWKGTKPLVGLVEWEEQESIPNLYWLMYHEDYIKRHMAGFPSWDRIMPSQMQFERQTCKYLVYDFDYRQDTVKHLLTDFKNPSPLSSCRRIHPIGFDDIINEHIGPTPLISDAFFLHEKIEDGTKLYFTGLVAKNRRYRQISETHTKISNDRMRNYKFYTWRVWDIDEDNSNIDCPEKWDKYNCLQPESKTEQFNFILSQLKDEKGEMWDVWRISEIFSDAQMMHKRWIKLHPDDPFPALGNPEAEIGDPDKLWEKDFGPGLGYDGKGGSGPIDDSHPFGVNTNDGISFREDFCWAADSRGIILLIMWWDGTFTARVYYKIEDIEDQEWFNAYLVSVGLVDKKLDEVLNACGGAFPKAAGGGDFYEGSNGIPHEVVSTWTSGLLYDVSENVNKSMWDHYKIPYARSFALALQLLKEEHKIGMYPLDFIPPISGNTPGYRVEPNMRETDLSEARFVLSGTAGIRMEIDGEKAYRFRNYEAYMGGMARKASVDEFDQETVIDKLIHNDGTDGDPIGMYDTDDFKDFFGEDEESWETDIASPGNCFYGDDEDLPPGSYRVKRVLGVGDAQVDYLYGPPFTRIFVDAPATISHFGGPICLTGDGSLTFRLEPDLLSPILLNQWIYEDFTAVKWNILSTTIRPTEEFSKDTRIYVESFALERGNGTDARYPPVKKQEPPFLDGFNWTHPLLDDCLNIYPYHNALERLSIEVEKEETEGNLSIGIRSYKDWVILTTPDPQYDTITYHKIEDSPWNIQYQTWPSWWLHGVDQTEEEEIWEKLYDAEFKSVDAAIDTVDEDINANYEGNTILDEASCAMYNYLRVYNPLMCEPSEDTEAECDPAYRMDHIPSEQYAYKRGRNPTCESGAIAFGLVKKEDIFRTVDIEFADEKDMKVARSDKFEDMEPFGFIKYLAIKFAGTKDSDFDEDNDNDITMIIMGSRCRFNFIDIVSPSRGENLIDVRYSEFGKIGMQSEAFE